jgi:hypothetical protein
VGEPVLAAAGRYQVVLVASERPISAPRGALDADSAAAMDAGAKVVWNEIEVW